MLKKTKILTVANENIFDSINNCDWFRKNKEPIGYCVKTT